MIWHFNCFPFWAYYRQPVVAVDAKVFGTAYSGLCKPYTCKPYVQACVWLALAFATPKAANVILG